MFEVVLAFLFFYKMSPKLVFLINYFKEPQTVRALLLHVSATQGVVWHGMESIFGDGRF